MLLAILWMRSAVAGDTRTRLTPERTLEAVTVLTCAAAATSFKVTMGCAPFCSSGIVNGVECVGLPLDERVPQSGNSDFLGESTAARSQSGVRDVIDT